ncbi:hypothetical protein [Duganella sp. FT27W]|uniref:hypothetical protein n=1 Tax=Duganella sp. FT27W TaxID=2654636 RepID=UPI00128DDB46|nr:hypothetical protein [Duganella sp. FT27W]MPQ56299.1 hypothetical protein [Duganella sp. FT27W]
MDFEQYGTTLSQQYENFAAKLNLDYLTYRAAPAAAAASMRLTGLLTVDTFITSAKNTTLEYLRSLGAGAPTDGLLPYLNQIHAIAMTNLNELITKLGTGDLNVGSVLTRPGGAMGEIARRIMAKPELMAKDTAGRNWRSDKLVALLARDFAYQAYIDARVNQVAAAGYDMVALIYPNPEHRNQGVTLRIDQLESVRHQFFHPNATARLEAYVPA